MITRSASCRAPVTYKDIEDLVKPIHPRNNRPIHPLAIIDSHEEVLDLSFSLISEDYESDYLPARTELVKSVKQSLAELKQEATLYVHSSEVALKELGKKMRFSLISMEPSTDQEIAAILCDLKKNLMILNARLEKTEEVCTAKNNENLNLHKEIALLEHKSKRNNLHQYTQHPTNCSCLII
jgi:hypothetical protein